MNKFFLMTRGRTGSTSVLDESNKITSVCRTQELFIVTHFSNTSNKIFAKLFDLVLPSIFLKQKHQFTNNPNKNSGVYYDLILPIPCWKQEHWFWKWIPLILNMDKIGADHYLREAESLAERNGSFWF
jgi:hypothetical protein